MKKIIFLFAFTAFGYFASNAQTIVAKPAGSQTTTVTSEKAKPMQTEATDAKKDNCTAAERKNCGKKAGGKSCCAHKTEVKK